MKVMQTVAAAALVLGAQAVQAQSLPTTGTLVVVPAFGEVKAPNDQAVATFAIEEQDKDKAAAASRVNQKMKQGLDILKKEDPQASLKTQGYYTYPVYPEDRPLPPGVSAKARIPTAWRVGHYVQMTTSNLNALPKTVASVQKVLTLNNLQFGLSPAATKKLDDQRIAATYQNLNERIASIANAMGRKLSDAVLDTVDFEGSGNYAQREYAAAPAMMRSAMMKDTAEVSEPSFEPGETTLEMRLVGKVKFK
ncbi:MULTISPECIES: SIMPL domain-containing protein [Telluria group]|uniref:Putative secreted protein n=1 Tax=Pseudoduganella violacea TaxID=1715466 RepID=A0A7W5B8X5_9BURK|nr:MULTISPECIES: SIMPL domain-containing protein [Telluria group]MBB3118711.1 putative secreted protein [Pseudoduganella violacea]NVD98733.1 SIMPL domain-containing protein [Massilia sp. BJB1822]UTY58669.1 SIMPL domain-containing protein [Massilia sp. erpn]